VRDPPPPWLLVLMAGALRFRAMRVAFPPAIIDAVI
jgi:hypothetical protein